MDQNSTLSASTLRKLKENNDNNNDFNKTTKNSMNSTSTLSSTASSYWPSILTYKSIAPIKNIRSPIPSSFFTNPEEVTTSIESQETIESNLDKTQVDSVVDSKKRREERDKEVELDSIAESILYQAGLDSKEGKPEPLLVLAGCNFPSALTHDHSKLLEKLRLKLEIFTSNDDHYSIVILASPTPNAPGTQLLISNYLALPRTTRKNVRKVYIVGGSFWTRLLLTIFNTTLLTGKGKRKSVQCDNLSSLATSLGRKGFTQIEFPLQVYISNATLESTITLPSSSTIENPVFGGELDQTGESGLPSIFQSLVSHLKSTYISSPGLFRRSPSAATLKILLEAYERGNPVTLDQIPDSSYLAASLLKLFLRRLKEPVLPKESFEVVRNCPNFTSFTSNTIISRKSIIDKNQEFINYIRTTLLPILSPLNYQMLSSLISLLNQIALHSSITLMDSTNLAIVLGPSLIGEGGEIEEILDMCKVIDFEAGTINGRAFKLKGMNGMNGELGKVNTIGGVLRGLIECYDQIFTPSTTRRPSTSHSYSSTSMLKSHSSNSILSQQSFNSTSSSTSKRISRSSSKSNFKDTINGGGTIRRSSNIRGSVTQGEVVKGDGIMGLFAE